MAQLLPVDALKPREVEVLRLMAAGLSNEEIAARLVVAVTTVRWHNRQLYSKLGVHSRTLAVARARELGLLEEATVNADTSALPAALPPSNLPTQNTSFVGRGREIAQARRLLASSRLLTLTGPGGMGKTRLALQVADAVREYYPDGVWFVPLAAVQDPALVPATIAGVLKISEAPTETLDTSLVNHLRDKQMLLVLDNFEHLIPATPLLSALLAEAARLKLLVTSREVLRLTGEQEYNVPPLTMPEPDQIYSFDQLTEFEAVRLFVERAQASRPDFALTDENAAAIARLSARLDGLPLALELAAARIKLLSPQQMLARLETGLDGLGQGPRDAPARQRTLQTTIDWSYDLLTGDEKRLFARLGVFRGGWTLEAMGAICGFGLRQDTLDLLNSLIDKSLVHSTEGSLPDARVPQTHEPRFRMLEIVREYAWKQLPPDEAADIRKRHRDWFLQLAERGGKGLQTPESQIWYMRLRSEEDNLHVALNECLNVASQDASQGNDPTAPKAAAEAGLRAAGDLIEYWHARGSFREARAWLTALLARVETVHTSAYARALATAGMLAKLEHDYDAVERLCGEALEMSRTIGDREVEALALHYLAHVAQERGNCEEAEHLYIGSCTLFRAIGNTWGEAETTNCLGDMQRQFGRYSDAALTLDRALMLRRSFDNRRGVAATLSNLGHVLCRLNQSERAAACFRECLDLSLALSNYALICQSLCGFGGVALIRGELDRAAILLAVGGRLTVASGNTFETPDRIDYDWMAAQVCVRLSEAAFAAAWEKGRQMAFEQAIVCARATA